jgi:hypothetical protein
VNQNTVNLVHLILEWLFFGSGIALTIVAVIGLRQLTIAKNTARTNAKREAFRLAADQCAYYMEHIIPLNNALDEAVRRHNIVFFDESSVEVDGNRVKLKSTATRADVLAVIRIAVELTALYNALGAFSVYFTSGLADEKVAFSAVGTTFCNGVRNFLPDIVTWTGEQKYNRNIIKLFLLWQGRFDAQKLAAERRKIDEKLDAVKDKFITPIGT